MLDRLVVRRSPYPKRADVADGNTHIDGDPQPTDACVDGEAGSTNGLQHVDLCIEGPAARASARAPVDRDIHTASGQDGGESVDNGHDSCTDCIEADVRWLAFSA